MKSRSISYIKLFKGLMEYSIEKKFDSAQVSHISNFILWFWKYNRK